MDAAPPWLCADFHSFPHSLFPSPPQMRRRNWPLPGTGPRLAAARSDRALRTPVSERQPALVRTMDRGLRLEESSAKEHTPSSLSPGAVAEGGLDGRGIWCGRRLIDLGSAVKPRGNLEKHRSENRSPGPGSGFMVGKQKTHFRAGSGLESRQ